METFKDHYAICDSVSEGLFKNQIIITLGNDPREFYVDKSSLARTKDGLFTVVKFYVLKVARGLVKGRVYNCEGGEPGYTAVPLDSMCLENKVISFN